MVIGMSSLPQGTVTFLFINVDGASGMSARHRELVRDAVETHGGVAVDAAGDELVAAFASAAGAIETAVAVQRALDGSPMRIGVHTGEATLAADGYTGIAVQRGRQVCGAAHAGQVLVSSATFGIVTTDPPEGIGFSDAGEMRLAGFEQPEQLFQVVAEGLEQEFAQPRGVRQWQREQPALLERAEELAAVDAVVGATAGGAGKLVVIEGPAGIGKTSLLGEGRARAVAAGMTVHAARGSDLEAGFSFGVVRQLFEAAIASASDDRRAHLFGGAAAQAAPLFGIGPSDDGGGDDTYALLHGLYWLATNLAESQPLMLAVDDLQWCDPPSIRWLAYLSRRLEGVPICVLATLRPVQEEHPLLTELLADRATEMVRPDALSAQSASELVRQGLSSAADEVFCRACHRATGGNPLLLRELLRALAAEDVAPIGASVAVVDRIAPDAVTRSVGLRLQRLPVDASRLARSVAVLGDRAEVVPVAALAGLERRQVAPAAAALARADLLHPEPPYSFVHPLVRTAVYESIPVDEREAEHARAAELLAELSAPLEQVAAQVMVAPPESVPDAVKLLREAARRAAAEGGLDSAVGYLTRSLEEPLAGGERGELLLELAGVEADIGASSVITHLQLAVSLIGEPERRAEASLALGHALYWSGNEEQGVEVLERALADYPDLELELRHRLEAELVVNATRVAAHYERARTLLTRLDVSPDDGPGARVLVAGRAYHGAVGGGDAEEVAATAHAALAAMAVKERARNYTGGVYALLYADRLDEGLTLLDETVADVRRRGAVFQFSGLSMTRAAFQYARGALIEAEADARTALEALPRRDVWFWQSANALLAQILVERAAAEEAASLLDEVEPSVAPDAFSRAPLLRARAMVEAARGDHHAALARALDLGQALAAFGHTSPPASYPAWRSLAALEHHALGGTQEALALAREEVELARVWEAPRTLGRALRILGLIEGGDDGIKRIREAVVVLEQSPIRLEHAYSLANLGAALRRTNHRAEAREHLRQALDLAERCGATLLAEQAHEELIATGARPRRTVRTGAASLTPSERRVAVMAAEGLSNREIAQALFVTLRTIEMHLSNAFRKLDVSSRTQLPAALGGDERAPAVAP